MVNTVSSFKKTSWKDHFLVSWIHYLIKFCRIKNFSFKLHFYQLFTDSILKLFDNFDSLKNKIPQVRSNISWMFLLLNVNLMKKHFLFSTKYLIVKFSCLAILTTLTFGKVYLNLLYFLPYFFKIFLPKSDYPLNIISCFFVNSQTMLRQVDLNILNNLYLMLNFFIITLSNHALLVFLLLRVSKVQC